jgi:uncharacterized protein (DUF58 family)
MLPAELAREVKRIQFVTGRQVANVMAGAYLSVFKGRGMEFDEVRPYVPGDDVRSIDWNVTAGRPAPVPRRGRHVYIPPRKGDKHALRIIREVFARGREAPGSASPRWRPSELPRRVWGWFRGLKDTTARSPRRSTSIAAALEFCRKVLPRRAVVFVVSDFLDDGYLTVLRNANRKHDVVAAVVTDPREQEFVPAGLVTLEDAETGATRLVDTRSAAYRARVAADATARLTRLGEQLASAGVDVVRIDAAGSVVDPLLRFFRERERRTRR